MKVAPAPDATLSAGQTKPTNFVRLVEQHQAGTCTPSDELRTKQTATHPATGKRTSAPRLAATHGKATQE